MNDKELYEKEKNSKFFKRIAHLFSTDDVFWNNEIKANLFVSTILLMLIGVLVLSWVLAYFTVFDVPMDLMNKVLYSNIPIILFAIILVRLFKGSKRWIKYMLCLVCITVCMGLVDILSIFVILVICIPVVLSVRYYSRKFTILVSVLTFIATGVSQYVYGNIGILDLNLVQLEPGTTIQIGDAGFRAAVNANGYDVGQYIINLFRGSFGPHALFFVIISLICIELSRRAHNMVLEQTEILKKSEAVKTELNMATNIQSAVLPKVFPAFPSRPELDIKASMYPAKEVGGDFYDFYLVDDDHLVMVMADVSGKSIPAALFMMTSKILIKTHAQINYSPAHIATEVNKQLCEDNDAEMFVTAWIGVLEISTGIVTCVDCGHEYPAVSRNNGSFELIKGKKSFILAGMESTKFHEYQFKLERGDRLFLYTDGVPEATNTKNELYGIERLLSCLDRTIGDTVDEILNHVKEDVDVFVDGASQFDDLTMLVLNFKKVENE